MRRGRQRNRLKINSTKRNSKQMVQIRLPQVKRRVTKDQHRIKNVHTRIWPQTPRQERKHLTPKGIAERRASGKSDTKIFKPTYPNARYFQCRTTLFRVRGSKVGSKKQTRQGIQKTPRTCSKPGVVQTQLCVTRNLGQWQVENKVIESFWGCW